MRNIVLSTYQIMSTQPEEKIDKIIQTTVALGKVGLLIVEDQKGIETMLTEAKKSLANARYKECTDYLEIMDALSAGEDKVFYAEKGKKLDGLVLEIIAEFEAGIVSLADRKNNTGLKTAKWNPSQTSFIVIMTRDQIENSYPRLFEYINFTQSL